MGLQSDWGAVGGGYPARCVKCHAPLGDWPTVKKAGEVELEHQIAEHSAQSSGESGGSSGGSGTVERYSVFGNKKKDKKKK